MDFYPAGLKIRGKNVLVVGAGAVAERKVRMLRVFGAIVRVVAPKATAYIMRLNRQGRIRWLRRGYKSSDVNGARLVVAAASDGMVNRKAARDAEKRGIWVNVVDQASACGFIAPAVIRRRGLVVAVSTDAKNPPLSKEFKEFLEDRIDEFFSGRRGR